MNMKQQVGDLILVTGRLTDLLEKENEALHNKDTAPIAELMHEKNILTRAYEVRVRDLANQSDELSQVDLGLRDKLRSLSEKIDGLIKENAQLLLAGVTTGRHVIESIIEAVQAEQPGPGTYSANGAIIGQGARSGPMAPPITINESL